MSCERADHHRIPEGRPSVGAGPELRQLPSPRAGSAILARASGSALDLASGSASGLALCLALCLASCLSSTGSASGPLEGAYQVANGTRRLVCDGQAESSPFAARVWFFGGTPLRRLDGLSSCEFRFGPFAGAGEEAAEILPGQVCQEWQVDGAGAVTPRQILPLAWTVRRLPDGLLWEAYELLVVEGQGKEERRCRLSAAATLVPADRELERPLP